MANLFWCLHVIQSPKVSVQHIIHHRQTLVEESFKVLGWADLEKQGKFRKCKLINSSFLY